MPALPGVGCINVKLGRGREIWKGGVAFYYKGLAAVTCGYAPRALALSDTREEAWPYRNHAEASLRRGGRAPNAGYARDIAPPYRGEIAKNH